MTLIMLTTKIMNCPVTLIFIKYKLTSEFIKKKKIIISQTFTINLIWVAIESIGPFYLFFFSHAHTREERDSN